MELNDKLLKLNSYPFHMPGHKRNQDFGIIGSEIDITEINEFDNLHSPNDILKDLQEECAKVFNVKKSIISVNGSTCLVLASILALTNKNDSIIVARNCHKSVFNACLLNELDVHYIEPKFNTEWGCYERISQEDINHAIKNCSNAKAIVLTSPTYEGFVSEISANIPIIIDAAHGAHFSFSGFLPKRPNSDIVIESLHKTLPALTQTAVIHINNLDYYDKIKKYIDILETSSPSYVLMSSIDKCIDFLKESDLKFNNYKILLDNFYSEATKIEKLDILKNDDLTRIVLSFDGLNGSELSNELRKSGIEVEGASLKYVILISSVCDTKEGFELLLNALKNLKPIKKNNDLKIKRPPIPNTKFKFSEVNQTEEIDFENSVGKICGEFVYAYPPGAPIIAIGEEISQDIIDYINALIDNGVNIISDSNMMPSKILTKA